MDVDVVEKWIVGDTRRFGPTKEFFVLIPRHHWLDEDWYFRLGDKEAVPASRLFDTPQEAALAAIKIHDEEIRWAGVQKQNLQEWYDRLEAERKEQEALAQSQPATDVKVKCPVCKMQIGTNRSRIANHKWLLPHMGKRVPCQGSGRSTSEALVTTT